VSNALALMIAEVTPVGVGPPFAMLSFAVNNSPARQPTAFCALVLLQFIAPMMAFAFA